MSLKSIFTDIYRQNGWHNEESVSGSGSTRRQTAAIRASLPGIFQVYRIKSVLDIPCGDYGWWPLMTFAEPVSYVGADIVPDLIEANKKKHPDIDFRVLNLVSDPLPQVDLVFVRDCLGHLSNDNVVAALQNIKKSGAKYVMATTFYDPKWRLDADIPDGGWRPINLSEQFGLGEPLLLTSEKLNDAEGVYRDKSLGLWDCDMIGEI